MRIWQRLAATAATPNGVSWRQGSGGFSDCSDAQDAISQDPVCCRTHPQSSGGTTCAWQGPATLSLEAPARGRGGAARGADPAGSGGGALRGDRGPLARGAARPEPEVKAPKRPARSEVGEMEGLTPAGSPSALPRLLCRRCHWRLGAPTVQGTPSSGRGSRFTRMFPSLLLGNGGM